MMNNMNANRLKLLFFLNLTIFGSFAYGYGYGTVQTENNSAASIQNPAKIPDLREFSDDRMKIIFQELAENKASEDSKPFIDRVENYKNQVKEEQNLDLVFQNLQTSHTRLSDAIVPILKEICVNLIRAEPDNAGSDFNGLITAVSYLGNNIHKDDEIPKEQKQTLFKALGEEALRLYSTSLDQKPRSLKDAIHERIRR